VTYMSLLTEVGFRVCVDLWISRRRRTIELEANLGNSNLILELFLETWAGQSWNWSIAEMIV
jgi:hypothetical protein